MKKAFIYTTFMLLLSGSAYSGLKEYCAEKWPSDDPMQEHCYNEQVKAFKELKEKIARLGIVKLKKNGSMTYLPPPAGGGSRYVYISCLNKWRLDKFDTWDYRMVLYCFKEERGTNLDCLSDDITKTKRMGTKILMLYKERDPDHEGILNILTEFLDKAGFAEDKMDVEKLLVEKDKLDLSQYQGIMTCYQTSQMIGGDVYPYWLVKQMEAGRRILIIGSYGAYQTLIPKSDGTFIEQNESLETINTFFLPFGLEFRFGWTGVAENLSVIKKIKDMVEYQTELKPEDINYYQYYKSVNPQNRVYLEIERKDMVDSKSAVVVHTPFGGMLLEGYGYFWDSKSKKILQRVDMVRFIRQGLSGE